MDKANLIPLAVSIPDAATLLGISKFTVTKYVSDGRIRHLKCGRRVLIEREAILEFIEKCRAKTKLTPSSVGAHQ